MTLNEYHNALLNLVTETKEQVSEAIMIPSVNELLGTTKNRIFVDGKKADGSKIGDYSTKEMYATKEQFVKTSSFKNQGKTGKPTKSSMYLQNGYKQLRQIQGRRTDTMNMNYSEQVLLDYQMTVRNNEIVLGMVTERSSKIRNGQQEKRGDIWHSSQQEISDFEKNVTENTKVFQLKILNVTG